MNFFQKNHAILCGFFIVLLGFFIDQSVKFFVQHNYTDIILCNYGIAMGIEVPRMIFIILWCIVMIGVLTFWFQERNKRFIHHLPFVLIFSGGLSNTIDRLIWGCVIDFIPLLSISSFNVADVLVTVGAALWIYQLFIKK